MLELAITLLVLGVAYLGNTYLDIRHVQDLRRREQIYGDVAVITLPVTPSVSVQTIGLVSGCIVVGLGYITRIKISVRNVLGGRVTSLELLMERARHEAILRMKAQAKAQHCDSIGNVRVVHTPLLRQDTSVSGVEIMAYGTGLRHINA